MCGVARKVNKKEWRNAPRGKSAMGNEWKILRLHERPNPIEKGVGAWDDDSARELGM